MKIVNTLGVHRSHVSAIENNRKAHVKSGADYSVTRLLQPARAHELLRQNGDKLEKEAIDMLDMMIGSGYDKMIEYDTTGDHEVEFRKEYTVDGKVFEVIGIADWISKDEPTELSDNKCVKSWAWLFKGEHDDYVRQVNMNNTLAGGIAETLTIVYTFKDFDQRKADSNENYPQAKQITRDVPVADLDVVNEFIESRIRAMEAAKKELPECTRDEMQWRGDQYRVVTTLGGRSKRNLDSQELAEQWRDNNGNGKELIEFKQGIPGRCTNICDASPFCTQYQTVMEKKNGETN